MSLGSACMIDAIINIRGVTTSRAEIPAGVAKSLIKLF
jgi:hypothetical protein